MGKTEEEQPLPLGLSSAGISDRNVESRCGGGIRRLIAVTCVFFLLLSAAVFVSAFFWLPPFLSYGDWPDRALDSAYRDHEIVASFHAWNPVSFLENHMLELEDNIFGEIPVPFAKVAILSLHSLGGIVIRGRAKLEFRTKALCRGRDHCLESKTRHDLGAKSYNRRNAPQG